MLSAEVTRSLRPSLLLTARLLLLLALMVPNLLVPRPPTSPSHLQLVLMDLARRELENTQFVNPAALLLLMSSRRSLLPGTRVARTLLLAPGGQPSAILCVPETSAVRAPAAQLAA